MIKTGYICCVNNRGTLADYFERNMLLYQLENGTLTQKEMAQILHFSRGYLNQLLEGGRVKMSYHAALYCAQVFMDYQIMDILGYERPSIPEAILPYPSPIRLAFAKSVRRAKELGITPQSEEFLKILTNEVSKVSPSETSKSIE